MEYRYRTGKKQTLGGNELLVYFQNKFKLKTCTISKFDLKNARIGNFAIKELTLEKDGAGMEILNS